MYFRKCIRAHWYFLWTSFHNIYPPSSTGLFSVLLIAYIQNDNELRLHIGKIIITFYVQPFCVLQDISDCATLSLKFDVSGSVLWVNSAHEVTSIQFLAPWIQDFFKGFVPLCSKCYNSKTVYELELLVGVMIFEKTLCLKSIWKIVGSHFFSEKKYHNVLKFTRKVEKCVDVTKWY